MKKKRVIIKRLAIGIIVILTIVRIFIALNTPVTVAPEQIYDDQLMFEYSSSLHDFRWLGEYNLLTLVKHIAYPVFLSTNANLLIPYQIGISIFYIIAIIVFCRSLKPVLSTKARVIIYLLMLYSPIMLSLEVGNRMYRNVLLPGSVLLLFGSYIGLFLRRDGTKKQLALWSIASTISLVFFWNIKEDGIWALPFTGTLSLIILVCWIAKKRKEKDFKLLPRFMMLSLPILSVFLVNQIISFINFQTYGVYITNDKNKGEFSRMVSDIMRVEDNSTHDHKVWISNEKIKNIAEHSPTFAQISDEIIASDAWGQPDGEAYGDHTIWKIRYIMSENGFFETAQKVQDFSTRVADEIETAIEKGELKTDQGLHISPQMRGINAEDIKNSLFHSISWSARISCYSDIEIKDRYSYSSRTAETDSIIHRYNVFTLYSGDEPGTIQKNNNSVSSAINSIYKVTSPVVVIVSIVSYIILVVIIIKDKKRRMKHAEIFIILSGVGLSALLVTAEVYLFSDFLFDMIATSYLRIFYCAPVYSLLEIFKYTAIAYALKILFTSKDKRR